MTIATTLVVLVALVGVAAFAGWRGAGPFDPRRGPRMAPWRLIMLLSATAAVLLLVHLVNLAGVRTGR